MNRLQLLAIVLLSQASLWLAFFNLADPLVCLLVSMMASLCATWGVAVARRRFLKACDQYYELTGKRHPNDPRKEPNGN